MSDDDAFNRFVFDDAKLTGYTQMPPLSLAEMTAAIESLKRRLVVPSERVEEFETAVRTAGLDDRVTVVGHPWLKPDQAYLMQSEAEFNADMQRAMEAGQREALAELREQFKAEAAQVMANLVEEERKRHEEAMAEIRLSSVLLRNPFTGLLGLGGVDG